MRAEDFQETLFGAPTREPGSPWAFTYYLPRPIPRDLSLNASLVSALSEADAALGHLQGLGLLIQDPAALIGPYLRREALASTRIEGTQASLSEVLQAEIDDHPRSEDVVEVQRYLEATRLAHELAGRLPITQRLILDVHATLLRDVRGQERRPGELRASPVWIGSASATPETAAFVPPLPQYLPELVADWERFVNDEGASYPALVQAALAHYQFETIHPFLDGNGRIGRLLINLQLMSRGRLTHPLLYLSSYFEAHRQDYYGHLQGVRESGDIEGWLSFFLRAVQEQSGDAVRRARALIHLREELRGAATHARSNLPRLADVIVGNPYVTVTSIERKLGLTNQGARNLVRSAVALGWLESLGTHGRGGREHWYAPRVYAILEAPMFYDSTGSEA